MTRVELAPRYSISRIIKGGWQLAGGHGTIDRAQAIRDMHAYAERGITTFDCADIYTGVEELIGAFLREWKGQPIQVHTKCVPDMDALKDPHVERNVERSLSRLGVERLDLVQFHWWDFSQPGHVEAALQLAKLSRQGKIRLVGTTNFDAARLRELIEAGVPVASNQVQYSVLDRRPSRALAELCAETGVRLLCYGALAGGFLSEKWLDKPEPHGPLENRSLTKYRLIIDETRTWPQFQELLGTLRRIGQKHGTTIGAVALRFTLDQPHVAAAIAGSRDATHLEETLRADSLRLDADDRAVLQDLRALQGEVYALEREPGGRHAVIMKTNLNRS